MNFPEPRRSPSERTLPKRPRILMITQWFDPEPTFKGLLFAKELKRHGYEVDVVTGFPNYPGGKLYKGYRIRPFQREVIDDIRVLRVPLYPSHDGSGFRRALNYISFALSASLAVLLMRRPDVAYVYHPPATVGLPAMVLKAFKGVPYVYDVQDLWPDTLAATGMINSEPVLKFIGALMDVVYNGSARIVVLSHGFREALSQRSVPARRIEVIPNWAHEDQMDLRLTPSRAAELGFEGKFTVTFAGNMGKGQALETVLEAAKRLVDEERFRFLLIGGGVDFENLRRLSLENQLTNVDFMPRRPPSEIGEILALSDALLVHLRDDPLFSITIPSKTQAYLLAGRPIIMGVRGDAAKIVSEAGAGMCFEPENAAELAHSVRTLMAMEPSELQSMGTAGLRFYREKMSLEAGARRFADVLSRASWAKPHVIIQKRLIDIVGASLGLALGSVPMALTAFLVRRELGSPILFRQIRPGRDGEPFEMLKFRTMGSQVDERGEALPDSQRLSRLGSMLRSTSLDELPGLWNVLRGDMSLVGPRPLLTRYTDYFTETELARLDVKPGITGWAQVNGRNTLTWDERLEHDTWYVKHQSIALDIKILAMTVSKVFRRQGVIVVPESAMLDLDKERRMRGSK